MECIKLGSLVDVLGGKRLPAGHSYVEGKSEHAYLRVVDFYNKTVNAKLIKYISDATYKIISRYTISSDDVYISIAGSIGLVGLVPDYLSGANLTENAAKLVIKDDACLDKGYLACYLSSLEGQRQIQAKTILTTQPKLALFRIKEIQIPLPPLETQRKIVAVLDKAQELIDKRKEQIRLLDELIQSIFYDMFGDPVTNPKGWEVEKLGVICDINPKKSEVRGLGNITVSFVPMANVSDKGALCLDETRNIEDVYGSFTYFKDNDVLFAKITPCMENGKGCIARNLINGIGFGSTEFHVIRPNDRLLNSQFIYYITMDRTFRIDAEKNMKGSAGQKRVPAQYLENFNIMLPPKSLQNQFALAVQKIEYQKERMQQSLSEMENNFNSIMQRAFTGELFV